MSLPDVKVPGVFGNISPSLAYILLTSDGDAGDLQDADVLTIGPRMYMAMKQVWEKAKVDLSSGDDEVHDDGDPNMDVTEEEGEENVDDDDFNMERLQAEKNEYGVKDETGD